MVVNRNKPKYDLNIDYPKLLGADWAGVLSDSLLDTDYMKNLMVFLHEAYKVSKTMHPKKIDVFNSFKEVPLSSVRVVILGTEPYVDGSSTGIPLANEDKFGQVFHPELNAYRNGIERMIYDGMQLGDDPTLKDVMSQGVLFLNCALTASEHKEFAHLIHWRNFIRQVIKVICEWMPSVIFMFWGDEAQTFAKYVGDKGYILKGEHPRDAVKATRHWTNDNLTEANKILIKLNGIGHQIVW